MNCKEDIIELANELSKIIINLDMPRYKRLRLLKKIDEHKYKLIEKCPLEERSV